MFLNYLHAIGLCCIFFIIHFLFDLYAIGTAFCTHFSVVKNKEGNDLVAIDTAVKKGIQGATQGKGVI